MLSLLYVLRFGNYPSRQMKLQQIRGARIRKLKKVVKDFIVMSTRKNRVHEGVSITHTILFAYYFQARTSQLWLQFVAKENAMFYSYRRRFCKDKSTFVRDFWWDKKKHETIEVWKTNKLNAVNNLSCLSVLLSWIELGLEVDLDNQNIPLATKPSLVVAPGATGRKSKFQTLFSGV